MKPILLLLASILSTITLAQNPSYNFINANQIGTGMHNNGSLFFDEERQDAGFWNPYDQNSFARVAALFAGGIWMSGTDPDGNDHVAKIMYGATVGEKDYVPGPSDVSMSNLDYNFVWEVLKVEIDAHIEDFEDGVIDNTPADNLLNWPGSDPDLVGQVLAPFKDVDGDGIYNPMEGDYPSIDVNGMDCIPDQMLYTVYHDDQNNNPDALNVELHVLMFAYQSDASNALDNTLFIRTNAINKSGVEYSNFRLGLWFDPDLGCFTDDYMGCDLERNSVFVYNKDEWDGEMGGFCPAGVNTYANVPPAINFAFLNEKIKSFLIFNRPGFGNPHPATIDPLGTLEFTRVMNGLWRDGTPMTRGNLGYNPGSTDVTPFMFDGDPTDPTEWSMISAQVPESDHRAIATAGTSKLVDNFTLDIACIFSRDFDEDHLGNLIASRDDVEEIKAFYLDKFMLSDVSEAQIEEAIIYPNPNDGSFIIEDHNRYDNYSISDNSGKVLLESELKNPEVNLDLPNGIYLLTLKNRKEQLVSHQKIVIAK